jgi:hypothetical protein
MNRLGQCRFLPYGEGLVSGATGNITSITGAGTTKTLTAATGTVGAHTNKIIVILGNNGFPLSVAKITGGNGSSTYTFEGPSALTGGASGTWAVYERISTLHGTGSNTAITTDADVLRYTPSYGENGWTAGIVAFDPLRNGYYLNLSGYTDWRVVGNFSTNTSSQTRREIFRHGLGRNKNDNEWDIRENNGLASTNTACLRLSIIEKCFGCDYVIVPNSPTLGYSQVIKKSGNINQSATGGNTSVAPQFCFSRNSISRTSDPFTLPEADIFGSIAHIEPSFVANCSCSGVVYPEDVIRLHSSFTLNYVNSRTKITGSLIL